MFSPWRTLAPSQPASNYLAMLTSLRLPGYLHLPKFIAYSTRIQWQLEHTHGLVGYSVGSNLLRNQYWTLSVWENDGALMGFVRTSPHFVAMNAFRMSTFNFTRWTLKGGDIPPRWDDAIRRGKENANG
jgi:hypothetical protein